MKTITTCGKMSGKAITYSLIFPICCFLLVFLYKEKILGGSWTLIELLFFIILFTATFKGLGEWLFWSWYNSNMQQKGELKNWRRYLGKSLLTQPYILFTLLLMVADILIDLTLLSWTIKSSSSPILLVMTFSCCQGVGAYLLGSFFDRYRSLLSVYDSGRKALILSLGLGLIALALASQVVSPLINPSPYSLLPYFFLDTLSPNLQMLLILCGKGLLANTFPLARAIIAEGIQIETIREQKSQ